MARNNVFKKGFGCGHVEFNMTPMIDCTFQLIIFFILASSVISPALSPLELHRPEQSQATEEQFRREQSNRVIVNVLSIAPRNDQNANPGLASQCGGYKILARKIDAGDTDELTRELKRLKQAAIEKGVGEKEFIIEIRSDQRVCYEAVKPVMKAASLARIERMNITALTQ